MKRVFLGLAIPALSWGQDLQQVLQRGEQVFNNTCAIGYCHGRRGAVGGAPRLAARGFDQSYIAGTVSRGLEGTSMVGFATTLPRADLAAVVAYVASLNGIANPGIGGGRGGAAEPAAPKLTANAERGRVLFSDALKSFGRCSTCHQLAGIGIAVATPIAVVPADPAALKNMDTPRVSTATIGAESMPVLVLSQGKQRTLVYDLTSPPPVLRSMEPGEARISDGSRWRHSQAMGGYDDSELAMVLEYLRAAVK